MLSPYKKQTKTPVETGLRPVSTKRFQKNKFSNVVALS